MFNNMTEEDYIIYKQQQNILFKIFIGEYNEDFFKISSMENLRYTLEVFINEKAIIDTSKKSLYNFLLEARNINDNDRVRRIELINEMISLLNFIKEDENLEFYRKELYKRRQCLKYFLYDQDIIKNEISITNGSICCDFLILESHSSDVSEDKFDEQYLPLFINNYDYYEALNALLIEYPKVFKNEILCNRVVKVLEEEYRLNPSKDNKKIVKIIKKQFKKYK